MGSRLPGLGRSALPVAVALLGTATIALGAFAGVGAWLIAVVGGGALGALATAVALGLSGASSGALAPRLEPTIDSLTRLPTAQRLHDDLEGALAAGGPHHLFLYVLEGLGRFDDAYGEQCADALVQWLARRLRDAVGERGTVYRLRGGSFAVLVPGSDRVSTTVGVDASASLFEVGDGFVVYAAIGEVAIPTQAQTAEEAIAIADRRARVRRGQASTAGQPPAPDDRFADVSPVRSHEELGRLARAVGRRLGIHADALDELESAARLRDIGNVAIPSSVFMHPGELPGREWEFVRLHTIVGERLLDGRFGMPGAARLVRSSHERWDGTGYPDELVGERIPLAARIVFACSAFEDMRSKRTYRRALTEEQALTELRTNAGSQFDPRVVRALEDELATPSPEPAPLTG